MTVRINAFGQQIGPELTGWQPPPSPTPMTLLGRYCRLEPIDLALHARDLFSAYSSGDDSSWTYLAVGPFPNFDAFATWLADIQSSADPLFFVIVDPASARPVGVASYMRIAPAAGSIEVGHIHFSNALKKQPAATEAMYLMARWAFDSGYRRYEWKCDALNAPSRQAAERLGFTYEGIFRQATVYKGRSRDTAWFAIIDSDWPRLRSAFEAWLSPDNFDAAGRQLRRLSDLTRA